MAVVAVVAEPPEVAVAVAARNPGRRLLVVVLILLLLVPEERRGFGIPTAVMVETRLSLEMWAPVVARGGAAIPERLLMVGVVVVVVVIVTRDMRDRDSVISDIMEVLEALLRRVSTLSVAAAVVWEVLVPMQMLLVL